MNEPAAILTHSERLRLRAVDFELLTESGAFAECRKTELIDGDIYVMNAQLARNARVKSRLLVAFVDRLKAIGSDLEALVEVSVRVSDDSVPEPDIVLSRYWGDRFVPGEMAALVVEVADTTLRTDLGRKAELYASAGVPEYWVVDVGGNRVVIHADPRGGLYQRQREVPFGEPLISVSIAAMEIATANLLN